MHPFKYAVHDVLVVVFLILYQLREMLINCLLLGMWVVYVKNNLTARAVIS